MLKVLVTGAAGFIGSSISERLVERGDQVVGFDGFDETLYPAGPKRRNAEQLLGREPASFSLIEADLCDRSAIDQALDGVDVICHLAALAGVRPSLAAPERYIRTNLEGTVTVYEAAHAAGIDRIVFASSSSVYGSRSDNRAFREDDPCLQCASPYGATKRAGELLSSTYCDLYNIGISALRFFTVYGPRQRPDMAIHKFVRAAVTGESVPFFGDGSSRRDYTYIDDIVSGILGAIDAVKPGAFNIYNLGGTQTTSLAELAEVIERVIDRRIPFERLPDQPGDVPTTFADISRAQRDLGYQPTTSVEDGIEHFWRWFQEQGLANTHR